MPEESKAVRARLNEILEELYTLCTENGIIYLAAAIIHEDGEEWVSSFGRIGNNYDENLSITAEKH